MVSHFLIIFLVTLFFTQAIDIFRGPKVYSENVHKTLYLDNTFDDDEIDFIIAATLEWNVATEGRVIYDVAMLPTTNRAKVLADGIIVIKVTPDFPKVILYDLTNQNNTLGYWEENEGPIPYIGIISSRISNARYKSVVMHEIGHSLGLKHNEGESGIGTLMYPTIDEGSNTITPADIKKFCELHRCTQKSKN